MSAFLHSNDAMETETTDAACIFDVALDSKEVDRITTFLMERYGPLLDRDTLVNVLGFPNRSAFDRYRQRGLLSLRFVRMPNRVGVFALASDTASHLVKAARSEQSDRDISRSSDRESTQRYRPPFGG